MLGAISFLSVAAQPCLPDTTIVTAGMYPINGTSSGFEVFMPDAMVNVPYNEIVQLLIPADTIIDTLGFQIPAQVLSMRILDFDGLPPSMGFDCSADSCQWAGNEHGCVLFHGTPSWPEVGTYDVDVLVYGTVSAGALGSLSDTIIFKMHINVAPGQGINEFVLANSVKMTPNPFSDLGTLKFEALKDKDFTLELFSITGQTVSIQQGRAETGMNEVKVDASHLSSGIYFYSLQMDDNSYAGRFVINR